MSWILQLQDPDLKKSYGIHYTDVRYWYQICSDRYPGTYSRYVQIKILIR